MDEIFLIGICVILPIIVVFLNNRTRQNEINKKTEVMIKAIEAGVKIDPETLTPKPQQVVKTTKEKLLSRLTAACIVTAIGISICLTNLLLSYAGGFDTTQLSVLIFIGIVVLSIGIALFIVYFKGKRMLANEIKAEEESLKKSDK